MKTIHTTIQIQLYDHLRGELSSGQRDVVDAHLRTCAACREDYEALRALMDLPLSDGPDPSAAQPDAFWTGLLDEVDRRVAPRPRPAPWYARLRGRLLPSGSPLRPFVLAVGALLIVLTSALMTWTILRQQPAAPAPAVVTNATSESHTGDARLQDYLRRSRALLTGVVNMPVPDGEPVDLRAEAAASRLLVREARALREEPLDMHSAQLLNDLERIQIELANIEPGGAVPGVTLVRQGIEDKNLLFKIRIAETLHRQVTYEQ